LNTNETPPKRRPAVARRVRHALPKQDAGSPSLDPHQAKSGGAEVRPVRYRLTIVRHGPKLLDIDNGVGGCKPVIDALRYEGWIPNDDPRSIDFVFRQLKAPRDKLGTEIIIEPLG
jgi:hypothetical protein